MKINKQILDKAIKLYRKFYNSGDIKIFDKFVVICREIGFGLERYPSQFADLIRIYVFSEATNKTIYKAFELLGVEIE